MFKGHPKGLFVLFFANMGERFGYYTMIAIFALFLQAKFGLTQEATGSIWGVFLFVVYFFPLFGGILADKLGYGKTVTVGILLMILGYALMGIPGQKLFFVYGALFVIALGTGLFKGNLVVILGNLYEEQGYKKMHDSAFSIYYMGINVGAFFAPYAATFMRNVLMNGAGFTYDAKIPGLAHLYLKNALADVTELTTLAKAQMGASFTTLEEFCNNYIAAIGKGYNAAFIIAACSIVISLLIFIFFKKYYKHADYLHKKRLLTDSKAETLTPLQVRERLTALCMVFAVVIFFWMAFHQNGLTLTWFARDYTAAAVDQFTAIFFDLPAFLAFIFIIVGVVFLIKKGSVRNRLLGGVLAVAAGLVLVWRYRAFSAAENPISPELFQAFNPIFVVFLTPVVVAFFTFLNKKAKEPSSPKKIFFGMMILTAGWFIMLGAAQGLASPKSLLAGGGVSPELLSPYWLISLYFTFTISELFISPMGLAFVAKVAPPQFRGMMQGGWLAATALGNMLSGLVAIPYANLELWQTFGLLTFTSLASGLMMLFMLKKLDRITK